MTEITLIPGDGIGPEIVNVVRAVLDSLELDISWKTVRAGAGIMEEAGTPLPEEVLDSIKDTQIALKGPIQTPVGSGFHSVNVAIRQQLNLYANLRPIKSLPGVDSRYNDLDLIVVRENTEGLYRGIEHYVDEDAAEAIRVITRRASRRIGSFAFEYARDNNRQLVTAVHKANILKYSDGLFLETIEEVARDYPDIDFNQRIVDNMCMQLVQYPDQYDVLVLPNLYGDIVSDLGAGLIGGLGLTPGANIGQGVAVFEAVHGSAPDITGDNIANPLALLRSAVMMLNYMGKSKQADRLEEAIILLLREGHVLTPDLGGNSTTTGVRDRLLEIL
ncbi:MAG: isocitrate/isopropylmalate dehydrogenase family protein [Bacillota bacterium]